MLEAVVVRALARRPDERYATADELRGDLMRAMRALAPDTVPDREMREVMRRVFADRIEDKREMANRLRSGSELTHLPSPEVDP
ncbi:hypothetical protein, partial [Acinetobacter baumannii]|uniref:hypothetical protein n=1 Tax=Acinetobacter baumannii TaxID=470 RepID=UPI0033953795